MTKIINYMKKQSSLDIDHAVTLPPGRDLNTLIGQAIFGIKRVYIPEWASKDSRIAHYIPSGKPWRTHSIDAVPLPDFSGSMEAAWRIIEAVSRVTKIYELASAYPNKATACFISDLQGIAFASLEESGGSQEAAQALAVCRAALLAGRMFPELLQGLGKGRK